MFVSFCFCLFVCFFSFVFVLFCFVLFVLFCVVLFLRKLDSILFYSEFQFFFNECCLNMLNTYDNHNPTKKHGKLMLSSDNDGQNTNFQFVNVGKNLKIPSSVRVCNQNFLIEEEHNSYCWNEISFYSGTTSGTQAMINTNCKIEKS